jgi:GNAT superfamily N-acetyltransferase
MSKRPVKRKKTEAVSVDVLSGNIKQYEFLFGESAHMEGMYNKHFQEGKTFTVFDLEVAEDKRRQGIGSRCLRAAAIVAKDEGAKKLAVILTSYPGLLVCENLFGSADVRLRHQTSSHTVPVEDRYARTILRSRDAGDQDPNEYIVYEASLEMIDTQSWERPKLNSSEA